MTKRAGLSRAYAVLRQLEALRQQDVLDPLPPATETGSSAACSEGPADSPPPPPPPERPVRSDALQRVLHDIVERRRQATAPTREALASETFVAKSSPRTSQQAGASAAVSDYTQSLLRDHSRRRERSAKKVRNGRRSQTAKSSAVSPDVCVPLTADLDAAMPRVNISRALSANFDAAACSDFPDEPLLPYVCDLFSSGSSEIRRALLSLPARASCRDWFALTALLNTTAAISHIVVPLFLEELAAAAAPDSRTSHVLCALAGLGGRAGGALGALVAMLRAGRGPPRLVALAARAVGGDGAVAALCRVAASRAEPAAVRAAAVYGVGLLARSAPGHTAVGALDGVAERVVFHQPRAEKGARREARGREAAEAPALQRPPPYRPTVVLVDADAARRRLLELVDSSAFRREEAGAHAEMVCALRDFARAAPEACKYMGIQVPEAFAGLAQEAEDAARGAPQRMLPFAYDPHFVGHPDKLFVVEETLLTTLLDSQTPASVVEQVLVTIASLPEFATTHAAQPMLDFVVQCVASLDGHTTAAVKNDGHHPVDGGGGGGKRKKKDDDKVLYNEEAESVAIAGLVSLGRIARGDATPPAVTDAACELMLYALASHRSRVRHGACIGLGEIGAVSNRRNAIVSALTACFFEHTVHSETVAWALARVGKNGVRTLLDAVEGRGAKEVSRDARITAARALAKCDVFATCVGIAEDAEQLRLRVVRRLSDAIVRGGLEESVAVECAYALGEFVAGSADLSARGPDEEISNETERTDEAAAYYCDVPPNEAQEILCAVLDAGPLPFSVQKALFFVLCTYGGPHGELYASQTVIQSADVISRAAAVFGLRACGGKVIRALVVALNDESAEVRCEAFDTLDAVGTEAVLSILRTRPRQHTQQVVAALRDCLLRDMTRNAKRQAAQEIYAILSRVSLY